MTRPPRRPTFRAWQDALASLPPLLRARLFLALPGAAQAPFWHALRLELEERREAEHRAEKHRAAARAADMHWLGDLVAEERRRLREETTS